MLSMRTRMILLVIAVTVGLLAAFLEHKGVITFKNRKTDNRSVYEISSYEAMFDINISEDLAVNGGFIDTDTPDGRITLKIPEGTKDGQVFRIRNKGFPKNDGSKGDVFLRVKINER